MSSGVRGAPYRIPASPNSPRVCPLRRERLLGDLPALSGIDEHLPLGRQHGLDGAEEHGQVASGICGG
jgi:hypothetical protein